MYQCVLGFYVDQSEGVILADDMGLGKTLQSIALIYVLSKQGPQNKPVLKRTLILTNNSLVDNWKKEFSKWLGEERLKVMVAKGQSGVSEYLKTVKTKTQVDVVIMSYETFVKQSNEFEKHNSEFDLLVCDEGHRLRNDKKQVTAIHEVVKTSRRIILTGTPFQNNYEEFFFLTQFVNPNAFGKMSYFKRVFEDPIKRSKDKNATSEEKLLGDAACDELQRRLGKFCLRRTNDILASYLPPKSKFK